MVLFFLLVDASPSSSSGVGRCLTTSGDVLHPNATTFSIRIVSSNDIFDAVDKFRSSLLSSTLSSSTLAAH